MQTLNEVKTSQPVSKKNQPVKNNRNFETQKSTRQAKLETLRRKTIRSEKYRTA